MKSIKIKITSIFIVVIALVCTSFTLLAINISRNALMANVEAQLPEIAKASAGRVSAQLDVHWNALAALAQNDSIIHWNTSWDEAAVLLSNELARNGGSDLSVVDLQGNTKSTINESRNVADREYFKAAMAGNYAVSDPVVSAMDGSIIMVYIVPIKDNGEVVGALMEIRDGSDFSDYVSTITYGETGAAFIINSAGTMIAHKDKDLVLNMENYIEDSKTDPAFLDLASVLETMIAGGTGYGEYVYNGVEKACGYSNIENTNWSLALTAESSEVLASVNSMRTTIILVSVVLVILGAIVAVIFADLIAKPIVKISSHLGIIAKGDFTHDVDPKVLILKDEIGSLGKSLETMQSSIKAIIFSIIEESDHVSDLSNMEADQMQTLEKQVREVSLATESLSAGIEETAASTEEMTATSEEIDAAADMIAKKASEGLVTATEISARANTLKENAKISKQVANDLYRSTETSLLKAIEDAKAVNEINNLSEAILEITNQTNLLALNASIEAARAGEAGKGFAVVASEIGNLAAGSKNTVNKIQDVTKVVLSSMQNLTQGAQQILDFVNTKVLKDYDTLVETGEQYNQDAITVDGIVSDLSSTSQELAASIQNMMVAINEVAMASTDGAQSATEIASRVNEITKEAKDVLTGTEKTKESASKMVEIVSTIKIK